MKVKFLGFQHVAYRHMLIHEHKVYLRCHWKMFMGFFGEKIRSFFDTSCVSVEDLMHYLQLSECNILDKRDCGTHSKYIADIGFNIGTVYNVSNSIPIYKTSYLCIILFKMEISNVFSLITMFPTDKSSFSPE